MNDLPFALLLPYHLQKLRSAPPRNRKSQEKNHRCCWNDSLKRKHEREHIWRLTRLEKDDNLALHIEKTRRSGSYIFFG